METAWRLGLSVVLWAWVVTRFVAAARIGNTILHWRLAIPIADA
jgi:hypothetical protein